MRFFVFFLCFLTDCYIIRDRNWLEFLAVLDATFYCLVISPTTLEDAKKECATKAQETRVLFTRVVEEDGCKDRSGLLALLELEKRARDHGVSEGM
jgi:N-terminal acetyltransferase B complex non-catalytic subunit